MFCMKCGAEIKEGDAFCVKCGTKAPKMEPDILRNVAEKTEIDDDRTVLADDVLDENNDFGAQFNGSGQDDNLSQDINNRTVPSSNTFNGAQAPLNPDYDRSRTVANFSSGYSKQPAAAKQKKNGSGALTAAIVFLVISILAVLGVGGYFVYQTFIVDSQYEAVSLEDELKELREKKEKDSDSSDGIGKSEKFDSSFEKKEAVSSSGETIDKSDNVSAAVEATAQKAMAETTAETIEETTAVVAAAPTYTLNYKEDYNYSGLFKIPVTNVSQSSYLIQKDNDYINYGINAFDGDLKTSWQDGVSGDGVNEWIKADLDKTYSVSAITFALGNHRSEDWHYKNNRPSSISISIGGHSYKVEFPDQFREFCVSFSEPIPTDSITFTIGGKYSGTHYNDMTIAEIGVFGN